MTHCLEHCGSSAVSVPSPAFSNALPEGGPSAVAAVPALAATQLLTVMSKHMSAAARCRAGPGPCAPPLRLQRQAAVALRQVRHLQLSAATAATPSFLPPPALQQKRHAELQADRPTTAHLTAQLPPLPLQRGTAAA
eukprot:TRINITY_DN19537_c0_g1_i1.p2 TRINITY_DN19537_c0_g1~~TRINITY_DN19537_c0_g1_i1.p2  ORF type:complete len:137 (+),score=31.70 TRINITY_DN19537_c0_g1_i1:336-746(+)